MVGVHDLVIQESLCQTMPLSGNSLLQELLVRLSHVPAGVQGSMQGAGRLQLLCYLCPHF